MFGRGGGWLGRVGELGLGGFGWAVRRGGALAGWAWGEVRLWVMMGRGGDSGYGRKPPREQGPNLTGHGGGGGEHGLKPHRGQGGKPHSRQGPGRLEPTGAKFQTSRGPGRRPHRGQGLDLTGARA